MKFNSIQFIGTQRSGSNLLRLMLDRHKAISAPHPPHLLQTFYPLLRYYGSLQDTKNRSSLVNDMCDWVEANPVPWEGVALDRNQFIRTSRTVFDVFRQLYEARMTHDRANIWCCKSTFNINYVNDLESTIRPFYIYLYRDGRDVATSFKKAIVGPKHTYHLAKKWSDEQKSAREFLKLIPVDRYISLAYEAILENPSKCIQEICNKLDISFDQKMMQFYDSTESRRTADSGEMWKNVLKPVIKNNTGKYQKELPVSDLALFESIAGSELENLGYERVSNETISFEHDIPAYEIRNLEMQEQTQRNASIQDREKRAAQKELLQQIKDRLGLVKRAANPA